VTRRYAILDDNDAVLEERLAGLHSDLPPLVADRVCAIVVIGSVAEGRARDGSDIDLVLVLCEGTPRRGDYDWWDREVAPRVDRGGKFRLQPVFVGKTALATTEPHLSRALKHGLVLWDPQALVDDQHETRA
jgi:hypothetical protein